LDEPQDEGRGLGSPVLERLGPSRGRLPQFQINHILKYEASERNPGGRSGYLPNRIDHSAINPLDDGNWFVGALWAAWLAAADPLDFGFHLLNPRSNSGLCDLLTQLGVVNPADLRPKLPYGLLHTVPNGNS